MTDGQKYRLREVMAICQRASQMASQSGANFSSQQALIYTTISLTMYWVMAVLEVEPHNQMAKSFEEVINNAKRFGIDIKPSDIIN